jgi:hypothetical protein
MKYTPEEIAAVRAESRRILEQRDDKPPKPLPEALRPEVQVNFEDDMDRWRREARESDEREAAAKAELRREERAAAQTRLADRAAVDVLTAEVAALRRDLDAKTESSNELARGLMDFGNTVETKLVALEAHAARLQRTLDALQTTYKDGFSVMTARLAGVEAAHARDSAFLTKQLQASQHELTALKASQLEKRTREQISILNDTVSNVVTLVTEDIARRGGDAA